MRWNDKNSDYAKERRGEDKELDWREDHVAGWDRWSLACLGAGGEENLLEEIKQRKVEELDIQIKRLELKVSQIVEAPFELYCIKDKHDRIAAKLRDKHQEVEDGEVIYFYRERYWREIEEVEVNMDWHNIHRKLEEYEKKSEYIETLEKMYSKRKKLSMDLSREELFSFTVKYNLRLN
ncbi:hypothetical protein PM10SUCC1_28300 [Propionigenium maris DSM 9537]|uniref:Uncharacterized protein n=1 Tax=Propionigenium maris DSM 9537 TaxID=1123000 RepID=A0A9W6LNG2_9FUSO|nr:hypothetical protein [Propionigenium maris]GLI57316.1 hypothetical protein PM10SUCC1_28300 [Propionigenium maris DSM 9537]